MAFTAIDAFVEHGDPRVVLQCSYCPERVTVYDTLDAEHATDVAEQEHQHRLCVACGEAMDKEDERFNVLACLPCRMENADDTEAAVQAHIEAMSAGDIRSYMERFWGRAS